MSIRNPFTPHVGSSCTSGSLRPSAWLRSLWLALTVCIALAWPTISLAQITADSATSFNGNASSGTFAHTVGSGTNRLLIVIVSVAEKDTNVSSVSYSGQAMSLITSARGPGGDGLVEAWGLRSPPSGAANVVVTLSKSRRFIAGAISFANVHQTNTYRTVASALGNSTSASVTVASAANDVVVGGLVTEGDVITATVGSGSTSLWWQKGGSGGSGVTGGGSRTPGAASTTVAWTISPTDLWAIIAVPIRPIALPTLSATQLSTPYSDPYHLTTNPLNIPGATVSHSSTFRNTGEGSPDSNSVAIVLSIPSTVSLSLADMGASGSGPIQFVDGSTTSALTYAYTSLSSTTDNVDFSNDNGASWTYVPVPDAQQTDANISAIRVRPQGTFAASAGGSTPTFDVRYRVKIR